MFGLGFRVGVTIRVCLDYYVLALCQLYQSVKIEPWFG